MKSLMFLGCVLFIFSSLTYAQNQSLVFGVLDIRPMVNIHKNKIETQKPGFIIELLLLLEKHLNIKIEFKICPAKRCFVMLAKGEIDGIPMASFSPDRAKHFGAYPMLNGQVDSARKVFDGSYALYTLKNSTLNWDGEKFSAVDLPIGVNLGFSVAGFLKEHGLSILENNSAQANMEMLLAKRVAGVAVFKSLGNAILKRDPRYKAIVMQPIPLTSKPYYMVLSHQLVKNKPQLAEDIWNGAAKIGPSLEYQKIIIEYLK